MSLGEYRHTVLVQNPNGPPVADSDGGYTQAYVDLAPPTWKCSIEPATVKELERIGTVISAVSHIIKGHYRSDITTGSRIIFNGRRLNVTEVQNPEERNIKLELVAVEVVA